MSENIDFRLPIAGILLGAIGVIGTFYQILGQKILWIILIIIGFAPALFYLWKIASETGAVVKTFGKRWRLEDGQLTIGNTVNVALRTKTVQELLNAFQRELLKDRPKDYSSIVKEAGNNVGESFAGDLKNELTQRGLKTIIKPGKTSELLKEKLGLWAEYDSTTGMGLFNTDQVEIRVVSGLGGYISLKNSFLANDSRSELPTCIFIEGYIEGIINKLLGIPIIAKEIECGSITGSEYCKFEIKQKIKDT